MSSAGLVIGYDGSAALSDGGGISRYTLELLHALVEEGRGQAEFVVLLNSLRGEPDERHQFLFEAPHVRVVRRRLPGPFLVQSWRKMGRPSWESLVREECHLVHAPASYIPPARCPVVATVHDLGFLRDLDEDAPLGGGYFRKAFPKQLPKVHHIVTPSHYVASDVTNQYGITRDKITAIASGLSDRFHREAPELTDHDRRRYGLSHPYVLVISDCVPRKRPWLAAETWRALGRQDIQFACLGLPPQWRTPDMVGIPRVTDEELTRLYRSAKALLLTTREEGFGFPLLEAMALRTPVVCAEHSALAEVGGALPFYASKETGRGYAKVLADIIENPPGEDWRTRAQAHARQFTWQQTAREMLKLYREVLGFGTRG